LIKPQYVDAIPKAIKGAQTVSTLLDARLELDNKQLLCDELELNQVLDREIAQLSGGELQRFAIAITCVQKADVCVRIYFLWPYFQMTFPTGTCSMNLPVTSISSSG
jgi:translation initiation factor RLI1